MQMRYPSLIQRAVQQKIDKVRNGIKHAKKHGTKTGRPFGRPKIEYRDRQKILRLHQKGQSQRSIAQAVGVSRGTVQNVLREGA